MLRTSQEVEAIIRMIPGVQAVRVVQNESTISEVHILAAAHRHAMLIVRDVESALAAHLGVRIDRRVVSVAQLRGEIRSDPRLVLDTVQQRIRGESTHVQVELTLGESRFVGEVAGPASRLGRMRLAAEATLVAVAASLSQPVQFLLDDVQLTRLGDDEAVVLSLLLRIGGSEQLLVGSSFVWRDEAESAARAALSAINRRYGQLKMSQILSP